VSALEAARKHRGTDDKVTRQRFQRPTGKVCYPSPATAVNRNLVDSVELNPGERLFWKVIRSPDGQFVYDYRIQRPRRRKCPESGCQNLLEPGQRKCSDCQSEVRRSRNRRYYERSREGN